MARVRLIWVWLIALIVAVMAGCGGDDSQTGDTDAARDTKTDTSDVRTDATDVRLDAPTDGAPGDGPGPIDVRVDVPVGMDVAQDAPRPPDADAGPSQDVRTDPQQDPPIPPADVQDAPIPPPDTPDASVCTNDNQCPANRPHCNTTTGACVSAASLAVTPTNPSIALGTQQQFQATITYSDNSTGPGTSTVVWASATTGVATISAGGLATSATVGSTLISATLGAISGSTTLTVTNATLSSIAVTPPNPTSPLGTTRQFTATGTFSNNTSQDLTNQVTWASATMGVATINTAGLATTVAVGDSLISATSGAVSGSTTLHVTSAVLNSIAVTPTTPTIARFTTQPFQATGTYSDGTTQNLTTQATWASNDVSVATVSNTTGSQGIATGTGAGTSMISAAVGAVLGSTVLTVTGASLQSISVTPGTPTISKGLVLPFTATGTYSDASTQNLTTLVTWTSSDPSKAVISNTPGSQGVATTVDVGQTTIAAAYGSVTGSTLLTINAATLTAIGITPTNPSIAKGTSQQFQATGTYTDHSTQNITTQVLWGSSNAAVGPISNAGGSQGLASGSTPGDTTISAQLNGINTSTNLHVTNEVLVSIGVTPTNTSIAKGLNRQFTAIGTYSDNSTQDLTTSVTWNSSNPAFATISNALGSEGSAHAVDVGTVTIGATIGSVTGSTQLTVTAALLVSIQVTPPTPSIPNGTTVQFAATGTYTDSTTQTLTDVASWSSNNGGVATVSNAAGSRGLATANGTGSAIITASYSGVSGFTTLTVTAATLVSIAVTPTNPTIAAGTTKQFQATGTYTDGSIQNVNTQATWATTNNSFATISNTSGSEGLATGVAAGEVDVSATIGSIVGTTHLTITTAALLSVQVTPTNRTIPLGTTQQFTATGTYTGGGTQDLTVQASWSSSASNVATVSNAANSEGEATALAVGSTVITATFNGVSGQTNLTVNAATLQTIAITPSNQSIANGSTIQYKAVGTYTGGSTVDLTTSVTWDTPGNHAIATVSSASGSEGRGSALSVGGPIDVTATLGTVVGTTQLTVTAATLSSIAITPNPTSIARGTTRQFIATGTFSDASTQILTTSVNWGSSNSAVATISNAAGSQGLATGVTPGTGVIITASLNGITGSATMAVTSATLTSISVTPVNGTILVGATAQYVATGSYSDATQQDISQLVLWESLTPATATISNAGGSKGLATGVAAGTTTIRATQGSIIGTTMLTVN